MHESLTPPPPTSNPVSAHEPPFLFRFELEARSGGKGDKFYSMGLLDEIMGQIPGRDNYPAELVDTAFGEAAVPTDTK